jgi:DegV family protein with EDD domain
MSGVAVCTDSSALLPGAEAERLGIMVVPVAVSLDGRPFDERELGVDGFYERLAAGAVAMTSQPSPGKLLTAYERAAAGGARSALSLHLDARVSGTVDAARLAARDASIPVTVVDCATVSFGVGVCVRAAAESLARGASAAVAAAVAGRLGPRLGNVFVAASAQEGRVGAAHGWNVLSFADGVTRPLTACTTVDEAVSAMATRVAAGDVDLRAAVGHAGTVVAGAAGALADALAYVPQVASVERYRVGAAVGAHTGPLSFGAFWWPAAPAWR